MTPDVQLNEERRADAYNEASLRKEIRFFSQPACPPLEAFSFFKYEGPSILFFSADRLDRRVLLTSENSLDKEDVEARKDGCFAGKGVDVEKRREQVEAVLGVPTGTPVVLHWPANRHS